MFIVPLLVTGNVIVKQKVRWCNLLMKLNRVILFEFIGWTIRHSMTLTKSHLEDTISNLKLKTQVSPEIVNYDIMSLKNFGRECRQSSTFEFAPKYYSMGHAFSAELVEKLYAFLSYYENRVLTYPTSSMAWGSWDNSLCWYFGVRRMELCMDRQHLVSLSGNPIACFCIIC